eukprot:TRINITY_DN6112_c0_g1_i2.p1 TRINITY_DN6112_c0_g1~~TRINITY_DN6112_c0_g1_i2.p1  ORF type:complete len:664 (-),score=80.21 TRINITY_DN6112_c0_g1_i2:733-2724(-)
MSRSLLSSDEVQSLNVAARGTSAALVFHGIACGNCFKMPKANQFIRGERLQQNPLQPCSGCQQIHFCNKACQERACTHGVHREFCSVFKLIPPRWSRVKSSTQGPCGWAFMLEKNSLAVFNKVLQRYPFALGRVDLARDALMLSRHCIVCNRTPAETKLRPCSACLWDWSCDAHSDNDSRPLELRHTAEACKHYRDANAAAYAELSWTTKPASCPDLDRASHASFLPSSEFATLQMLESSSLREWDDFFLWRFGSVLPDVGVRRTECIEATFDASRPLTLILAIKQLIVSKQDVLVHVIGAGAFDMRSRGEMWRLVLQHLRPVLRLRLVFIGDQLTDGNGDQQWPENDVCTATFVQVTYQRFRTQPHFETPDLAIAFNAGLHAYAEWEPALQVLMDLDIPVVITGRTSEETKEFDTLKSVGAKITQRPLRNPFCSLVPKLRFDRKCLFESDNVFYICFQNRGEQKLQPKVRTALVEGVRHPGEAKASSPKDKEASSATPPTRSRHVGAPAKAAMSVQPAQREVANAVEAAEKRGASKQSVQRTSGGSGGLRLKFTDEDDRAMQRWVAEQATCRDQGRKIWERAAEANITTHSWQSMQNRWRRHLRKLDVGQACAKAEKRTSQHCEALVDAAKLGAVSQRIRKRPKKEHLTCIPACHDGVLSLG